MIWLAAAEQEHEQAIDGLAQDLSDIERGVREHDRPGAVSVLLAVVAGIGVDRRHAVRGAGACRMIRTSIGSPTPRSSLAQSIR